MFIFVPQIVIFNPRPLIVHIWVRLRVALETSPWRVLRVASARPRDACVSQLGSRRHVPSVVSLTDVRAGMSGSLPGGSVISRLLINADPFNSEPENL